MQESTGFLAFIAVLATVIILLFGASVIKPKVDNSANQNLLATETQAAPTVDFADPARGNLDSRVVIVEFGNYKCDACGLLEQSIQQYITDYPDKAKFVWKDVVPGGTSTDSYKAAIAARCAGQQGMFWEYHRRLMNRQREVLENNFLPIAIDLGLGAEEFKECYDSSRTSALVERTHEEAIRLRIDEVPYLFIGEQRYSGALSYDQLKALIDSEHRKNPNGQLE